MKKEKENFQQFCKQVNETENTKRIKKAVSSLSRFFGVSDIDQALSSCYSSYQPKPAWTANGGWSVDESGYNLSNEINKCM